MYEIRVALCGRGIVLLHHSVPRASNHSLGVPSVRASPPVRLTDRYDFFLTFFSFFFPNKYNLQTLQSLMPRNERQHASMSRASGTMPSTHTTAHQLVLTASSTTTTTTTNRIGGSKCIRVSSYGYVFFFTFLAYRLPPPSYLHPTMTTEGARDASDASRVLVSLLFIYLRSTLRRPHNKGLEKP